MPFDPSQSQYDPSRPTVGKIYRDAQMEYDGIPILTGDMSNEVTKGLVEDINDALSSFSLHSLAKNNGDPFYLMIHEKKDLQMKSAIARRMLYFGYRPWPEDDTVVFWKNPKTNELRFCWALPHWSEMDNMIANPDQFDPELIEHVKAWKKYDLKPFGFYYHKELKWVPNPKWEDKKIQ